MRTRTRAMTKNNKAMIEDIRLRIDALLEQKSALDAHIRELSDVLNAEVDADTTRPASDWTLVDHEEGTATRLVPSLFLVE